MSQRAVFLDRDGTVLEHYDYLTDESQVQLAPGAGVALRRLKDRGFLLVMVTNQSAIARGMLTEQKLLSIHDRMKSLLAEQGVYLDGIYYCPYHPDAAVGKYRRESDLRKPAPGMLLLAAQEYDIDLMASWMVGDDDRDVAAGNAAGCRTILVEVRGSSLVHRGKEQADYMAVNLSEAANLILRHGSKPSMDNSEAETLVEPESVNVPLAATPIAAIQETKPMPSDDINGTEDIVKANGHERVGPEAPRSKGKKPTGRALLGEILREVKSLNRQQRFHEFSVSKLLAGIVQMLVFLCLVLAFWFGSGPEPRSDSVRNCLLLALTFQTMTLTLLIMHRSN